MPESACYLWALISKKRKIPGQQFRRTTEAENNFHQLWHSSTLSTIALAHLMDSNWVTQYNILRTVPGRGFSPVCHITQWPSWFTTHPIYTPENSFSKRGDLRACVIYVPTTLINPISTPLRWTELLTNSLHLTCELVAGSSLYHIWAILGKRQCLTYSPSGTTAFRSRTRGTILVLAYKLDLWSLIKCHTDASNACIGWRQLSLLHMRRHFIRFPTTELHAAA